MSIPASEFEDLYTHLLAYPLPVNKYRTLSGNGRSQAFGVVNRRCLPPDYSRQNWLRPYTFKLLLDFAEKWVDLSWNAITVNVDYKAGPHRDKGNRGLSYLVAFGDYVGGELEILEGDRKGLHDIKYQPIIYDFHTNMHCVRDFIGHRISLVYYWCDTRGQELPPCSVRREGNEWKFYRGDDLISKKNGLPHPLRGRKKETADI